MTIFFIWAAAQTDLAVIDTKNKHQHSFVTISPFLALIAKSFVILQQGCLYHMSVGGVVKKYFEV